MGRFFGRIKYMNFFNPLKRANIVRSRMIKGEKYLIAKNRRQRAGVERKNDKIA